MGTYFYKKTCFVHLKSTFQKASGAASLHSTHWPGTGVGGRGVAAGGSQLLLSPWSPRKEKSLIWNESFLPYYMTVGQAAALTGVVHKRLPGEHGHSRWAALGSRLPVPSAKTTSSQLLLLPVSPRQALIFLESQLNPTISDGGIPLPMA